MRALAPRAVLLLGLVLAVVALAGCGKQEALARRCPQGWTCYAPGRAPCPQGLTCWAPSRAPISAYCAHTQREWEQLAERELQKTERLQVTLERLIQQASSIYSDTATTVRSNPWHESSEVIGASVSHLDLAHTTLTALGRETSREDVAPSVALGRLVTLISENPCEP